MRKGLVELLRALLERASVNLLYLTATFLKKLSVRIAKNGIGSPGPLPQFFTINIQNQRDVTRYTQVEFVCIIRNL